MKIPLKKTLVITAIGCAFFLPLLASALALPPTPQGKVIDINDIIELILDFVWLGFGVLAITSFVIAGCYFLLAQGDPAKIHTARLFVLWGVIGVIVAILGFSLIFVISGFINGDNIPSTGACTTDSGCTLEDSSTCAAMSGTFDGPGSVCPDSGNDNGGGIVNACTVDGDCGAGETCIISQLGNYCYLPPLTGACYWNGTCSIRTRAACLGATYGFKTYCGDYTTCLDPC